MNQRKLRRNPAERTWRVVRGTRLPGILFEFDRAGLRLRFRRGRRVEIVSLAALIDNSAEMCYTDTQITDPPTGEARQA